MKTRVHLHFPVRDLEASTAFYRTLFQVEPTKAHPDYASFRLDVPALHLALSPGDPGSDRGHYGVELFDDAELAAWKERLAGAGRPVREEHETTCCYATAEKFWVTDPDGRPWEFWVRHAEAPSKGASDRACCA